MRNIVHSRERHPPRIVARPGRKQYLIPMVKRSLDVLELLTRSTQGGLSLSELTRAVHAPKSSVFKIVSTLEAEGFVSKDPLTQKYQLTLRLLALANAAAERINLRRELYPLLKELKDKTGETVNLGILEGDTAFYIESLEGPGPIKVIVRPGKELSLHSSALGKALLAYLPETEMDRILASKRMVAYTPHTCTDPTALKKQLAHVRLRGYALDLEEDALDMVCVGAAIRDHTGRVVAATSVTAPRYRMSRSALKTTAAIVVEMADRMSRWLGWTGSTKRSSQ